MRLSSTPAQHVEYSMKYLVFKWHSTVTAKVNLWYQASKFHYFCFPQWQGKKTVRVNQENKKGLYKNRLRENLPFLKSRLLYTFASDTLQYKLK